MTVALTWICPDRPDVDHIDRGVCPNRTFMVAKRTLRPHGNHNPQHGGQFFMAPDNFHHLEGAHPSPRVFRLYLYDDYARQLPTSQFKQVKARVVLNEERDAATQTTREIGVFPLMGRSGGYLEARIDGAPLPARMTAKVQFRPDAPEYRFDFVFTAFTKAPARPTPTPAPQKAASAGTSTLPDAGSAFPAWPGFTPPPVDPGLAPLPVPTTPGEIVAQLKTRSEQTAALIERGDFTSVWVPAFQARDLAIALEAHLEKLDAEKREVAEPAITRVVRTAWLLDAFGDLGDREQIAGAHRIFSAAVAELVSAFN
jgi:hypothetical protein